MFFVSALSTEMPFTSTIGIAQNISFGFDFSRTPSMAFHLAPCRFSPDTNAPSRDAVSISSAVKTFFTVVRDVSLSSSHMFFWAATWLIAVRKDCGFTSPETHVTLGSSSGLFSQSSICPICAAKVVSQIARPMSDGQASFFQLPGNSSMNSAFCRASIESLIVSSPANPSWSSFNDRTISATSVLITSISCINTFWYGPCSSGPRDRARSSMSKFFSPNRSSTSAMIASAAATGDAPPSSSPSPLAARSCSERRTRKEASDAVVRKSISAFGWRPKAIGVSWVMAVSMCSMYLS
mmetsp:Transcript_19851/g.26948  ORF Transcript_19851/g.26948 Transcript_19851/m.26948 type:complete len:295 (-) Transcript_19851:5731-6615(-)